MRRDSAKYTHCFAILQMPSQIISVSGLSLCFLEQVWRSGEITHLPPMWPRFNSRSWRHMWVKFVIGSCPCSEGFSPGTPVFLLPQKPTFPNSNSTWKARTPLNEFLELFGASWINKLHLHLHVFSCFTSLVMRVTLGEK